MAEVYLTRPVKQFSGSRQPLADLALEGFEALLASGGAPPDRLLITAAHPYELAGISGPELAEVLGRRARELSLDIAVEFYGNPGIEEPTAHLAASAAGAALVHEAARRVASGDCRSIAVLGVEQMRLTERSRTTEALRSLIHPEERDSGLTMPALGALLTRRLESEFPGLSGALTALTIANRRRTVANPRAHIRKALRLEDLDSERNPVVSDPLRLFDVAPTSSGYAGLFLTAGPGPLETQVVVAGIGRGLDRLSVARRAELSRSAATTEAMEELLNGLGWTPDEFHRSVAYAEIHDAFPIIEFLGLLDCHLVPDGDPVGAVRSGRFDNDGACPVNALGGVMGGHPIGATGVGQIVELYLQAVGRSEVKLDAGPPHFAFAFNVGGPLTYNCVTLLAAFRSGAGLPRKFELSRRPHAVAGDIRRDPPDGVTGTARILSTTRLEFPPAGREAPCHIALVETGRGARVVPCLEEPPGAGALMELVRTNGHVSAVPVTRHTERKSAG